MPDWGTKRAGNKLSFDKRKVSIMNDLTLLFLMRRMLARKKVLGFKSCYKASE